MMRRWFEYDYCMSLMLALFTMTAPAFALEEIPNAADMPGLLRVADSVLIGYRQRAAVRSEIPTGPWKKNGWTTSIQAEGQCSQWLYLAPPQIDSLEVIRHYQEALVELGYQSIFQCIDFKKCGKEVAAFYYDAAQGKQFTESYLLKSVYSEGSVKEPRIQVVQRRNTEGESYIFIFAAYQDNYADSQAGERVAVFIEELRVSTNQTQSKPEEKPQFTESVAENTALFPVLSAAELLRDLTANGHAVIYGIQFTDDQATIRPEAAAQLEQIARLFNEQPKLSVYLVGHTDNQGNFNKNLTLSTQRAEAVMQLLIRQYRINSTRLSAMGVGGLAPLTTNANDDGRARNRRLEIVAR
ncbi:OmpA family protein [Chromatium okenii]|nr:OmpA family protein [Chromatium okenii]